MSKRAEEIVYGAVSVLAVAALVVWAITCAGCRTPDYWVPSPYVEYANYDGDRGFDVQEYRVGVQMVPHMEGVAPRPFRDFEATVQSAVEAAVEERLELAATAGTAPAASPEEAPVLVEETAVESDTVVVKTPWGTYTLTGIGALLLALGAWWKWMRKPATKEEE